MHSGWETRLILRARVGDREALENLLSRVQTRLREYIVAIVGRTAADDVLQDTLLQICRNLKWLRDPELFLPWAYRIASRASFGLLRRDRRFVVAAEESAAIEEIESVQQPERQFFALPELLEKISPASRAVLTLHYLQDIPIQEAAAILEIKVGTAKSRLAYGLACLREIVKGKEIS